MKVRKGKIFNLFPVNVNEYGEADMPDCFINNHFMWLFYTMDFIECLACLCLGIPHKFIIKFDDEAGDI